MREVVKELEETSQIEAGRQEPPAAGTEQRDCDRSIRRREQWSYADFVSLVDDKRNRDPSYEKKFVRTFARYGTMPKGDLAVEMARVASPSHPPGRQ